jgi:carboxymethylenebutenolidase
MYQTNMYEGMLAETTTFHGNGGEIINAYFARPLGAGPFPGIVVIHHLPGWDEWYREVTRKFAYYGYAAVSPNLYYRDGHGTPEDVAAKARGGGGVPDDQVMGDVAGALQFLKSLPYVNGKVGVFGTCSGGRHAYLAACRVKGLDAAIDCWGGRVVMTPADLTPKQPVAPVEYTADLSCPLLGIFGDEDRGPKRNLRNTARPMNSTVIRMPDMASSITTGRPTGRNRRWMVGRRYSPFLGNTSRQLSPENNHVHDDCQSSRDRWER